MTKPRARVIKGWRQVVRGPGRPGLRHPYAPALLAPTPAAAHRTGRGANKVERDVGMNTDYVVMMEAQLKQWDADVDALAAEGAKASAESRAACEEGIKGLRASREAAGKTFEQIRSATQWAGAQMQVGMDMAWEAMQATLRNVSSELRK